MVIEVDLNQNIVLYENEKFTKTNSQLPNDPDPWASLIALRLQIDYPNLWSTAYIHFFSLVIFLQRKELLLCILLLKKVSSFLVCMLISSARAP